MDMEARETAPSSSSSTWCAAGNDDIEGRSRRDMSRVWMEPGEKAVVIPDVHNKWKRAEAIISSESPDRVIFLGDYFDDFDDTPEDATSTAMWLKRSLDDEARVHLVGNHDLNYMTSLPYLRCSGYEHDKSEAVKKCGIDLRRLEPYCWLGGSGDGGGGGGVGSEWLCTHAGLSAAFLESVRPGAAAGDVDGVLRAARTDLDKVDDPAHPHVFLQAGSARGGSAANGGIVWCDYRLEFEDVPGLRQIFGHTRYVSVRHGCGGGDGSEHYCIDTSLSHYISYENGAITVRYVGDA